MNVIRNILLLLYPLFVTAPIFAAGDSMSQEEAKIRSLQQEWMDAWRTKNRAALENILADDFVFTLSTAPEKPFTRAGWMDTALGPYNCESFSYEAMSVRLLGDIAVVSSLYRQKANVKGVDRSGQFFLTDVWRKTDKGWRVVARYSSRPETSSESTKALSK